MVRRLFQDYKVLENKKVGVDQILPGAKAYPIIEEALAAYDKKRRAGRHQK